MGNTKLRKRHPLVTCPQLVIRLQSHVRATLASIKVIVDRTNCIYGVRDAMAREDYEAGAEFVDTFLTIEERHAVTTVAADSAQAAEQAQVPSSKAFSSVITALQCREFRCIDLAAQCELLAIYHRLFY